ncbi:TPA: cobalt transporter, partial [Bacillus cereus]|nr:cobalt transporter [Bacillus cereus]
LTGAAGGGYYPAPYPVTYPAPYPAPYPTPYPGYQQMPYPY